jgi:hypothetical protein
MNIPKYSQLFFTIFFDLEEIIFENVNISEINIINVELTKVLTRVYIHTHMHTLCTLATWPAYHEGMWCKDW